jgi:hypothetical protein
MIRFVLAFAALASVVSAAHGASKMQSVAKACNIDTVCAGVQPGGGRVIECLREHLSSLSDECLASLGLMMLKQKPGQQQNGVDHPGQVLQSDGTFAPANSQ